MMRGNSSSNICAFPKEHKNIRVLVWQPDLSRKMNEIRLKRKTLAAKFNFSSFPKGVAKENNFLSMQAPPWLVERCMLELEKKKGQKKDQKNYRLINFN